MLTKKLIEKNIVLGITGGIAAYKTPEIARLLRSYGTHVQIIMTKAAKEFITPLTLQTVSGRAVYDEMFNQKLEAEIGHISVARWAHAVVIAPATANVIAKLAHGIADDLLTTMALATKAPIAIAPAMNREMWLNLATQKNIETLRTRKIHIFGPAEGLQACGEIGPGRMLAPVEIVRLMETLFVEPILKGKKVVITAGPTQESIDPVRYITNHSSGKMGYAIASAAVNFGATVHLISGPTSLPIPSGINFTSVTTAEEMFNAVMSEIKGCDIFIASAAVADYKPEQTATQKLKKNQENMVLHLIRSRDILSHVAALPTPPFTVGFAAETENIVENALAKLKNKKLDMIAANLVGKGKAFGADKNEFILFTRNGMEQKLALQNKTSLAHELLAFVANTLGEPHTMTRT